MIFIHLPRVSPTLLIVKYALFLAMLGPLLHVPFSDKIYSIIIKGAQVWDFDFFNSNDFYIMKSL